jgi:hypothetical protein
MTIGEKTYLIVGEEMSREIGGGWGFQPFDTLGPWCDKDAEALNAVLRSFKKTTFVRGLWGTTRFPL